jgi:hypothetical protein
MSSSSPIARIVVRLSTHDVLTNDKIFIFTIKFLIVLVDVVGVELVIVVDVVVAHCNSSC